MEAARRADDARLLQRLGRRRSTTTPSPPSSCTRWPTAPPHRGLRIAYEALAWGRHVSDLRPRAGGSSRRPTTPRSACAWTPSTSSRAARTRRHRRASRGEKIFFLQLADAPHLAMDVLQWSRHYRCFPGQGAFDVAGFVQRVLAAGYAGPLSLEVFNDVFRQADPQRTAVDAMRSLLVLEDEIGGLCRAAPALAASPSSSSASTRLGADAEGCCAALGFAHVGPHRTKPVALWEQGDVRDRRSTTASATRPEVVAVAVESDDPDASAARAEALLAPVLERRRGPGEADLAAVEAPDGTSVFFCAAGDDRLARRLPRPVEAPGDAAGRPIDRHRPRRARAAVRRLRRGRAVLPLRARPAAGRERRSSPRPTGSCAAARVANADGRVRIVLNVPALAGRDAARPSSSTSPSPATTRCAAARAMQERGVAPPAHPRQLLRRPGRPARPRPGAARRPARARRALRPRARDGELLHFYTARVGGRVFFEVLERRGAYDGYGAVNSPVRMAAQRAPARWRADEADKEERDAEDRHLERAPAAASDGRFTRRPSRGARAAGGRRRCAGCSARA